MQWWYQKIRFIQIFSNPLYFPQRFEIYQLDSKRSEIYQLDFVGFTV